MEREELVKTNNLYLTITDLETFDYVEGRFLVPSNYPENVRGDFYCKIYIIYQGVLHIDPSSGKDVVVPKPRISDAGQFLLQRLHESIQNPFKNLFCKTFRVDEEKCYLFLNEPFYTITLRSDNSIQIQLFFKYRIYAPVYLQDLVSALTEGTDPTESFIRDPEEIERNWEVILKEHLPKELRDVDSAMKFFTEKFPIYKKGTKVIEFVNFLEVNFSLLFDFVPEDPSATPLQLAEYQFGFPIRKESGNALRETRGDARGLAVNILLYLGLIGATEEELQQAAGVSVPPAYRPYALYREFPFTADIDFKDFFVIFSNWCYNAFRD